ncbi:C-x8-C-x5-C-x3-H type zinc finger protein-like protein [Poronia punctata]|nr:C-x8-C-x5-C-x3-H type zinc finger protein-like protein [Poronia punctata]
MAMGEQGPVSIMDFVPRYREFELNHNATHQLIRDLMIYAERLETTIRAENTLHNQQMRELKMDLDDATTSRRLLQHRLQSVEQQMEVFSVDNDKLKNQNPYVLLLIDGDGLIFRQDYIKQGIEGGKKAASELRRALAAESLARAADCEIFVKVFANMTSLNKALERDGSVESESDLLNFVTGFNQASFFEFVDMGTQKESANMKLKENAIYHMQNPSCRQVIMGVSHDATFGPILDEIIQGNADKQERITVLEGCPTVRAVAAIGTDIIRFNNIFRSDKLTDRRTVSNHSVQSRQSGSSTATSVSERPTSISYATVTQKASPKVSPPPQITLPIPLAPKNANVTVRAVRQPTKLSWNPGPRGLDTPIPLNQTALDTIKKRKDNNKLCNNHFLRGPCAKGDECCFVHDYTPNKDERNAIAFLARLNPCTNGQDCDVDNCIYGHHCPSVANGICTHPYCKFRPEEHPPGTKLRGAKA